MILKNIENTLQILEKIERAIANLYGSFAVSDFFSDEVKRFWATMMAAELAHAELFKDIRERYKHDKTIHINLNFNTNHLIKSYQTIKNAQQSIINRGLSEKNAYALGAKIEENLYEYSYSKRVNTNKKEIADQIQKVEDETKHHYFQLHNYSLEYKRPSRNK